MIPRTATHDPVVLAIEATIAGVVQILELAGHDEAADRLRAAAGNDAYVACVAREARLDAIHGGRGARIEHLTASLRPAGES